MHAGEFEKTRNNTVEEFVESMLQFVNNILTCSIVWLSGISHASYPVLRNDVLWCPHFVYEQIVASVRVSPFRALHYVELLEWEV